MSEQDEPETVAGVTDSPPVETPPPADTPDPLSGVREDVSSLRQTVEELAARVETLTPVTGEPDATPVRRPWTARGRR